MLLEISKDLDFSCKEESGYNLKIIFYHDKEIIQFGELSCILDLRFYHKIWKGPMRVISRYLAKNGMKLSMSWERSITPNTSYYIKHLDRYFYLIKGPEPDKMISALEVI